MTNLEEAEKIIVELCERAEAKGWTFMSHSHHDGKSRGCVLDACAFELGLDHYDDAGQRLGIRDTFIFGASFDLAAHESVANESVTSWRLKPEAALGTKLARRFVHKEGVSK